MVKLNKIYTRTGDDGTSGLVDGSRLPKTDALFAAIGDVDEANSIIGFAILALDDAVMRARLTVIQNDLFDLGADLATPAGEGPEPFAPGEMALRIVASQVDRLEAEIDAMNAHVPPLSSFILPGGSEGSARLHLARTATRRAERSAVAAATTRHDNAVAAATTRHDNAVAAATTRHGNAVAANAARALNPAALAYLNRLSDWLFVACRAANGNGANDVLWVPGASR